MMQQHEDVKVLMLTPTNKASDVLTSRIMTSFPEDNCGQWLIRFGTTGDEMIESSGIYRDKTLDIQQYKRCTVVTTIARFAYDFFFTNNCRYYLFDLKWDYIVIDEASMIPLVNILYPLFKQRPREFIIAGDPFQIEPIVSIQNWKNENIYTMSGLNTFLPECNTIPYKYPVERLTTQYRSIPAVGEIFSRFAYNGVLSHFRTEEDIKELNVGSDLIIKPLNIIKFPVSKYESIYRPKKLNKSNYQIYSTLFTFEFSRYLAERLCRNNPDKTFSIGIIAPYRAEADLIEKLKSSVKLPKGVSIQAGTIHGFQGDECDIIFAVFNTPPKISASPDMFLNKKNIINVAISRARDYLFIVMPDDDTEGIDNLRLVKRVEALCRKHEERCYCYLTKELETIMFNDPDYLEKNTFSTGHQSVNVYGLPEMKYEIRSEDNAVDVQIHEKAVRYSENSIIKPIEKPVLSKIQVSQVTMPEKTGSDESGNRQDTYQKKQTVYSGTPVYLWNGQVDKPIQYYSLPGRGIHECYFDDGLLEEQPVVVLHRINNKRITLYMRVCPVCKRMYLYEPDSNIKPSKLNLIKCVIPQNLIRQRQKDKQEIYNISTGKTHSPKKTCEKRKKKPSNDVLPSYSIYSDPDRIRETCRWPGCKDTAFRNGLCWDHFQHEMGEI